MTFLPRSISLLIAVLVALVGSGARAADKTTAVVGGTLIHPERPGAPAEPDVTVIFSGERIQAVGPSKSTPVPKGAKVIEAKGKKFDPNYHQAVSTRSANDVEENTVIEEMRKGYTLNGRLLRPAMVTVSVKG